MILLLTGGGDVPDEEVIDAIFSEKRTHHADDAIDYEDIDELADEDEPMTGASPLPQDELSDDADAQLKADDAFDDMFGDGSDNNMVDFPPQDFVHPDVSRLPLTDDSNHLFDSLDHGHLHEDDGLTDINMDQMFHGDVPTLQFEPVNSPPRRSRPSLSPEERSIKRQKLLLKVKRLETKRAARNIAHHFPSYSRFQPFNFHKFFVAPPKYYKYMRPPLATRLMIKPLIPTKVSLDVAPDQRKLFRSPGNPSDDAVLATLGPGRIVSVTDSDRQFVASLNAKSDQVVPAVKASEFVERDWLVNNIFGEYQKDLILSTTDWDDNAILNAGDGLQPTFAKPARIDTQPAPDYDDENILNGIIDKNAVQLDMNDPNLLFVPEQPISTSKALVPANTDLSIQKFNFSNDAHYEVLKKNYNTKVRSQLSNLNIEHSLPALKLQGPFYKVKLTASEARSYHRPRYGVRPGTLVSFSRLKVRKKKRDRGKLFQEIFARSTDLTCADTSSLMGMEYSEEYPQILSGYGMGSKIINYYRKERKDDLLRPKAHIGETHVLGVEDRLPFGNFGEVAPGDFVPTLYNNMIRAPIFKHEPRQTDFLLVRSHGAGAATRHYLRSIDFLFAVGNIFPAGEVPAPHSRKVTNIFKNRLKMVVYRVMNKNGNARVLVRDISKHFPDQNDMQNRQRLKEFMEYQRQGDDQGFWKLKFFDTVPTEDEVRLMITPEDAALIDSMQHGQQVLEDTMVLFGEEVKKTARDGKKSEKSFADNEGDDDERAQEREREREREREKSRKQRDLDVEIDIEEELTPWNLSRNFQNANLSKTMLQLNGEGDPTGIGLGFSFLRATQKNGFSPMFAPSKASAPKNNTAAYQQRLYEAEIKRIWYSQRSSLVDHGESEFSLDAVYEEYPPQDHMQYVRRKLKEIRIKEAKLAAKASPDAEPKPEKPVLRISRRVRDQHGVVQRRVETLTDPRLIRAYIHRKKQIEDELLKNAEVGDILPTNDKELNKIRRKALEEKLANLEKRAKQSKAKKPINDAIHAAAAAGGTIIDANTVMLPDGLYAFGGKGIGKGKSKTRRCAACGAFGHIRTRKTCPLYNQTNGGMNIPGDVLTVIDPHAEMPPANSSGGDSVPSSASHANVALDPVS